MFSSLSSGVLLKSSEMEQPGWRYVNRLTAAEWDNFRLKEEREAVGSQGRGAVGVASLMGQVK